MTKHLAAVDAARTALAEADRALRLAAAVVPPAERQSLCTGLDALSAARDATDALRVQVAAIGAA